MTFNAPLTSYNVPLTKPTNGLATAALVLGIVAAVGAFIPFLNIGSMIIAVVAVVLGAVGLGKARTIQIGVIRAWFGIILAIATIPVALVINVATADVLGEVSPRSTASAEIERPDVDPEAEAQEPAGPEISVEEEQAVLSATSYLDGSAFSRQGLIDQLSSQYGEDFPVEVAASAVDSLEVDWNAEAAEAAASYLEMGGFSRAGLIDQLSSEHGEQFTLEQAEYGVSTTGL